ncbi:MAG TPA: 2Fe-2S iron-sulfur cluster binding domain-containing protein [Burkholderiales bacterium]
MRVQVNARNRAYHFDAAPGEKILYAGLRAQAGLPYECATGTCGTCKAKLVEGRIADGWPSAPGRKYLKPDAGEFLMCQCSPEGDVSIEVASFVYPVEPGTTRVMSRAGTVSEVRALTHDVSAFDVELDAPCEFDAGQFMAVGAPGVQGMRGYSMVNYGGAARRLSFVTKKKSGGGFSEWLFSGAARGARLNMVGPLGKATFQPAIAKNILCIAGGSGIAGMMSILARAKAADYFSKYKVYVFFGVRTMRDVFFLDELAAYPQADVTIALSEEDPPNNTRLRFERGLVHEVAKRAMAGKYQNVRAYLAGPPPAVDAAIRVLLLDARLTTDNIRYDKFS